MFLRNIYSAMLHQNFAFNQGITAKSKMWSIAKGRTHCTVMLAGVQDEEARQSSMFTQDR